MYIVRTFHQAHSGCTMTPYGPVVGSADRYARVQAVTSQLYERFCLRHQVDPGLLPRVEWESARDLPADPEGRAPVARYAGWVVLREGTTDQY